MYMNGIAPDMIHEVCKHIVELRENATEAKLCARFYDGRLHNQHLARQMFEHAAHWRRMARAWEQLVREYADACFDVPY